MNLYKYHTDELNHKDKAQETVPVLVWETYKDDLKELKKREDVLAKNSTIAFRYVTHKLHKPFPLGEPAIAKDPAFAFDYAYIILKGPFKLGEPTIAKDTYYSAKYAFYVLKHRFPPGEPAIAQSAESAYHYANKVIKGQFKLAEPVILKSKYKDNYLKMLLKYDVDKFAH